MLVSTFSPKKLVTIAPRTGVVLGVVVAQQVRFCAAEETLAIFMFADPIEVAPSPPSLGISMWPKRG